MSLCENHSCSGGVLTAATRTAFTSTRASSAGNNPLQDIDDSPSSGVEDQNIGSQHASSTVTISRQGRQLSLKVKGEASVASASPEAACHRARGAFRDREEDPLPVLPIRAANPEDASHNRLG